MKRQLIPLLILVVILPLKAQESIHVNGKTIIGTEAQEEYWVFQDAEDTLVAMHYSEYVALYRKAREARLDAARLDSILQAKDELIASFENYEEKADRHIGVQEEMISLADSLYRGYEGLYNDLKTLYDVKSFSLIVGTGLYSYDQNRLEPLLNLGVEYRKFQAGVQFGRLYKGLNLQYRLPLF